MRYSLKKLLAVRWWRRFKTVGDVQEATVLRALSEADCSPEEADAIYQLSALPLFDQRFVIPPAHREEAIEAFAEVRTQKSSTGFGFRFAPKRGL